MRWRWRTWCAGLVVTLLTAMSVVTAAALPSAATTNGSDFISRVTSRATPVRDSAGNEWAPGAGAFGTAARTSNLLAGKEIAGTNEDVLYQVVAYGDLTYSVSVPVIAKYRVRLLSAEGYWSEPGKRVFDVYAEDKPVVTDIDIVKSVGRYTAYDVSFVAPVSDGRLDLAFRKKVDLPVVTAVEVVYGGPVADAAQSLSAFTTRSTAHSGSITDQAGRVWSAREGFVNATKFNAAYAGKDVTGTTDDALYDTTTYGLTGYSTSVPAKARYRVRLLLMEPYWTSAGKRVFDVGAEGQPMQRDVDIAKQVGKGAALDQSAVVVVTDGSLDLSFVGKTDLSIVSAVEVTYLDDYIYGEPLPGHVVQPFASRMTARFKDVQDSHGDVWQSRQVGFGTWTEAATLDGKDITGTEDDVLYQITGWGLRWYRLRVPAQATYQVRLLLVENYFTEPGRRVFDVKAEGEVKAAEVDIHKAVGFGAAYDVSFPVTVQDGELTLEFVNRADVANVAGIEVVSTTPMQIPMSSAGYEWPRAVRFAPDAFWTQKVSDAPVAANSAPVVVNLAKQVADRYGGIATFNAFEHNASFNIAPPGQSKITVGFHDCQKKNTVPWGLFTGPAHFVDVPVPDDAVAAAGTDAAMIVYDPEVDKLWEFWQMRRNATTNAWEACWGGRLDEVSKTRGHFPDYWGTSATGMAMAGGMITIEDLRRGEINHAISLGVVEAQAIVYSWPAQRTDGHMVNPDMVMEGQRLRLDPTLDLNQYKLTPVAKLIAKAAQTYGFIVAERSGAVGVATESGQLAKTRTGVDPWDGLLFSPPYLVMRDFPWDKLQALPKDYGREVTS